MRWSNKLYNLHLNMAPSKAKDDAKSTKSSIRSSTSSLTKTAADGFNKLKRRATELLSPKKKAKATPKLTAPSGMSPRANLIQEINSHHSHSQPLQSRRINLKRQPLLTSQMRSVMRKATSMVSTPLGTLRRQLKVQMRN